MYDNNNNILIIHKYITHKHIKNIIIIIRKNVLLQNPY